MSTVLRDARERQGVGVRELARLCGVSAPTVVGWERSEADEAIQVGTLRRALAALDAEFELTVHTFRNSRALDRREERLSLELHRKSAVKLIENPDQVLASAQRRIEALHGSVRGGAVSWIDEWARMIARRDLGNLVNTFLGTDQHHVDMRSVSPFDNLLTRDERLEVLARSVG